MKISLKLLALAITVIMAVSVFALVSYGIMGETAPGYGEYGYYAYFDFENYGSSSYHHAYMRSEGMKNADGRLCDPFSFLSRLGDSAGVGQAVTEENGNTYYSYVQGDVLSYDTVAVFTMQTNDQNNAIIGDSAEISFRFRMHETQTEAEGELLPLLNLRRGSAAGRVNYLFTDIYGNIYINKSGKSVKVYTNSGDGEFMEISFKWYDVTNTYSLYVNGEIIVEAMPLSTDYRGASYVKNTYNDDFSVESRALVGTGAEAYRAIEILRRENTSGNFGFDIDDIKLSRIENAQGGAVYYENSFEGDTDGVSTLVTSGGSYTFSTASGNENSIYLGEENGNKFLNVTSGSSFGLKDNHYQTFTSGSYVVEFKVKAAPTHTSGYKSLLGIVDNKNVNWMGFIKVGIDGSLYLEENELTRINGYKLDGSEWLDFAVVVTKDETNQGKFGTFKSSQNQSSLNCTYSLAYYINGEFVGATKAVDLVEWKTWTESGNTYSRVSSNFNMTRAYTEGALDITGLTVVADGVNKSESTANHIIYKNADGSVYYDVEYASDKTTMLRYATMTIGSVVGEDILRFFIGNAFEGAIDDIRVYEGTSPEWFYEKLDSSNRVELIKVDFANTAFATSSVSVKTDASGSDVLGSFISAGLVSSSSVRGVDEDGEGFSTVTLNPGQWFDFYIPVPERKNGVIDIEYSFETTVKNLNIVSGSDTVANRIGFFSNRFENEDGYKATEYLLSVDASFNLWGGNCGISSTRTALYDKNGNRVKIDNDNWSTLRADIRLYSEGEDTSAEISYYLNGQLLYLADGSPAYRIESPTVATAASLEKFGNRNYRLRYTQLAGANSSTGDPGDTVTFDIKSINVSKNSVEIPVYAEMTEYSFSNNVSAMDFSIPNLAQSENFVKVPVVVLEKKNADREYAYHNLLIADLKSRELFAVIGGEIYPLCYSDGTAYKLSTSSTPISIVYDDAKGIVRYFIYGSMAYVKVDGIRTMAVDISANSEFSSFGESEGDKIKLLVGLENKEDEIVSVDSYKFNVYRVNDRDTAKLIGFQENSVTGGMRLIAGIDTLSYTSVGFEIETFYGSVSKGIENISGTTVYDSVVVNDKTLTAKECGYKYLTAAIITDVISNVAENSFLVVRSYAEINGIKHYDDPAILAVTPNGYYFVTDEVVYENNFNGISALPDEWVKGSKNSANSSISLKNGEIWLDGLSASLVDYYLDENIGSNYMVQADFRVTAKANDTRWMGLSLRLDDVSNYMLFGFRVNGDWFIEDHTGGSYQKLATGSSGVKFALGQTYTLSAVCYGNSLAVFLDGAFITEVTIPEAHATGKAGVSLGGVTLSLDNFVVKGITDKYDEKRIYNEGFNGLTDAPIEWTQHVNASTSNSKLTLSIKDDALYLYDWEGSRSVVCYDNELSGDYVFETILTAVELRDPSRYMGIVFGANDDGSMIAANMRMSDGRLQFEAYDSKENEWTVLGAETKRSSAPSVGASYKFRIECVNGYATFYLDGVKYARFEIPERFLSGKVGIILSQDAVKADNVKIFGVSEHYVSEEVEETRYELVETPVFEENFDGLTTLPQGWNKMTTATSSPAGLTVKVENNALIVDDMSSAIAAVRYDGAVFSGDYTVEADMSFIDRRNNDRYMGVLIGVGADDSFAGFLFRLSDGRLELVSWNKKDTWANIGETIFLKDKITLDASSTYHLKLVCSDGYATAYVDGLACGSFPIPEVNRSGNIGFITSQSKVKIDNVKVTELVKYELAPTYEENFDKALTVPTEWYDVASSSEVKMDIADGALRVKNETGRSIVGLDHPLSGNFVYEADITMTAKHTSDSWWMGPVFGIQEDGSYILYDANIVTKKWSVTPWNGKSWDAAIAKSATAAECLADFGLNVTKRFKLIYFEGLAIISVDGNECCRFEVPEKYQGGKVGVGFRNSTITVDNVSVYALKKCTDNTVLYEADFDRLTSAPLEWSMATKATYTAKSALVISADGENMVLEDKSGIRTVVALDREINGENFIYEAELTMTERHEVDVSGTSWWMGPVFGIHDDGSFAIMDVKILNGQWYVEPWTGSAWGTAFAKASSSEYLPTFRLNNPQLFRLECIDGRGTISINGVKICSFDIPESYRSGKVGIGFRNSTVVVDNVRLEIIPDEPGLNAFAGTFADDTLSLGENHVMHNKTLSFKFDLSEMPEDGVITIGHGDNIPDGSWIEVTKTTLTAYKYSNGKTEIYSGEHQLDLTGTVEIIVTTEYDTARARIKLANNTAFTSQDFEWSGRNGEIFAKSAGVTLENAKLSWNSDGFDNKVWFIGDGGMDIADDTSFAHYLKINGLTLIGSRNETAETALREFENALKLGTPEYAVWCIGASDADSDSAVNSSWKSALDGFLALCKDNSVTPILVTVPNTPTANHTYKNSVVTASGYRYIDLAKAVGASAKGSPWTTGMLSSDNSTPTASGAEAMYKAILLDFTEIKDYMSAKRIRVATYNVGNYTGRGLKRTSEEARVAYYELMESVDADIWGLQEDSKFLDNDSDTGTDGIRPYDAIYKNFLPNHDGFFTGKYNGKAFLTHFELYDVRQIYYPAAVTSYAPGGTTGYGHRWFLAGKINVDGKEISIVSIHLDWNCKERRAVQLAELVKFAKEQEYCIIMGDFNPEDYINNKEISKALFYEEELALFGEIGMTYANAGEFGVFDTLVADDASLYGPWDNILVSSNIKIVSAERVYVDWMNDHTIVVAEIEIN